MSTIEYFKLSFAGLLIGSSMMLAARSETYFMHGLEHEDRLATFACFLALSVGLRIMVSFRKGDGPGVPAKHPGPYPKRHRRDPKLEHGYNGPPPPGPRPSASPPPPPKKYGGAA